MAASKKIRERVFMENDGGGLNDQGEYVFPDGHPDGAGLDWDHVLGRNEDTPSTHLGHGTGDRLGRRDPAEFPPLAETVLLAGEHAAAVTVVISAVGHEALQHA